MYVSYFLTYEVQELTTSDETDLLSLKASLWHPFKGLCFTTYTCVPVVKTFEYKYYLRFYGIRLDEISRMMFVCLCRWERINRTLSKRFQSPPCRAKPWARTTTALAVHQLLKSIILWTCLVVILKEKNAVRGLAEVFINIKVGGIRKNLGSLMVGKQRQPSAHSL